MLFFFSLSLQTKTKNANKLAAKQKCIKNQFKTDAVKVPKKKTSRQQPSVKMNKAQWICTEKCTHAFSQFSQHFQLPLTWALRLC